MGRLCLLEGRGWIPGGWEMDVIAGVDTVMVCVVVASDGCMVVQDKYGFMLIVHDGQMDVDG